MLAANGLAPLTGSEKAGRLPIAVSTTARRNRTLRTTELYVAKHRESGQCTSPFLSCDAVAGLLGTAGPRRALPPVLVTSFVAYYPFRSVDGTWVPKSQAACWRAGSGCEGLAW